MNANPMKKKFILVEQPIAGHSSSTNAQQHTYATLDLSDKQNVNNKVKKSISRSSHLYLFLFLPPSSLFVFFLY